MRVLHIQKASGVAGSERHLLTLLPSLQRRGIDVRMCVLAAGAADRFVRSLRAAGVETSVLRAGPHANPALVPRLVREIRRLMPDLVHTHLIHADLHGQIAARLARVPAVSTMHGTHPFYTRRPYANVQRLSGRLARRTICVSEHVARFVLELRFARSERVRIIHHGIDAEGWELPAEERALARGAYEIKSDEVVLGAASRLVPHKGHHYLLDAFENLVTESGGPRLLIAGDGPLRPELEARARRLPEGNARFVGYVSDIRKFMNACDIVVFPTLPGFGEGFGLALLEAMAAARPVVATAIDSIPEIVVDGETGMLVRPGAVDELSSALINLVSDRAARRHLGAQGHERALTAFTVDEMVGRTMDVYREVV